MYDKVIKWKLQLMVKTCEDRYLVQAATTGAADVVFASCPDESFVKKMASHAIAGIHSDEASFRQAWSKFFERIAGVIRGSVAAVSGPRSLKQAVESMEK